MIRLAVSVLIAFVCLLNSPASARRKKPKPLTLSQAVQRAEQFIRENGYTDLPPTKDKSKIKYESIEWAPSIKELLDERYNTLERMAYGYVRENKGGGGWTIVFRFAGSTSSVFGTGRGVTMGPDGSGMRVEHQDFILKYAHKLRKARTVPPPRRR